MPVQNDAAQMILSLLDLTRLLENDEEALVVSFCDKALHREILPAAICVYPQFVATVVDKLKETSISVATVANFPHGKDPIDLVMTSIKTSLQQGADEIDVVFPYESFLKGNIQDAIHFVKKCKDVCGDKILKVILETGAFPNETLIAQASREIAFAGADFLKTSTGKIKVGATLSAARIMLQTLKTLEVELNRPVGLKVSGGIKITHD